MDKQDFKGIIPFKTAEDYNAWRAGTFTKGGEDFPAYNRNILAVLPDEQSQYVETGIEERVEQLEANAGGGKLYAYKWTFILGEYQYNPEVVFYSTNPNLTAPTNIQEAKEMFNRRNATGFDSMGMYFVVLDYNSIHIFESNIPSSIIYNQAFDSIENGGYALQTVNFTKEEV